MKVKPFHFKKFTIHQDRCALKVGTDGVLLGAWANCQNSNTILDIGSGTGVISLMLAQRSNATITAIEIDKAASEQCKENFENSPWSHRLTEIQESIQKFVFKSTNKFDLIVSNPPFYSIQKETTQRSTARSEQELNLAELFSSVNELLRSNGTFCLIFPSNRKDELLEIAAKVGLNPSKICKVRGNPNTEVKRLLIEFKYGKQLLEETQLTIERERHDYTEDYKKLLKDYLTIF